MNRPLQHKISQLLLLLCLAPLSLSSMAAQEDPKQAGIEITVNINQASAEEIATLLQGIGLKKAQAIVEYRDEHGKFATMQDLTKVKGIGNAILEKNNSRIKL